MFLILILNSEQKREAEGKKEYATDADVHLCHAPFAQTSGTGQHGADLWQLRPGKARKKKKHTTKRRKGNGHVTTAEQQTYATKANMTHTYP